MCKILMILGLAFVLFAFALFGHDVQSWLNRGVWSTTTLDDTLDLIQFNYQRVQWGRLEELAHTFFELPSSWLSLGLGAVGLYSGFVCGARGG